MNSVVVLILGFIVLFIGYRVYAKYIDTKVIKADPKRATPAKMYMDGVEFMPTSKNILFGYQFKSIAGAAPDHRADHRDPVGMASCADLDLWRGPLHRLGPGLLQRDDGHAKRRGLLRRTEPQADLPQGQDHPPRPSSTSICSSLPAPSETWW